MIDVGVHWSIHLDVTNACSLSCSNCTRLCAQVRKPFFMNLDMVERALESLADFPTESPPDVSGRPKVVGCIGGEPTLHPQFAEIAGMYERILPDCRSRGLWSSGGRRYEADRPLIKRVFGYENYNPHNEECVHQPVLVAISDVIKDEVEMRRLIDACWVQEKWAATITPKGAFFCEVAGALDMVFDGPGGLPVEPGWWRRPLADFQEQIELWCHRCGAALPLEGRHDHERLDDVSETNMEALLAANSPCIASGRCVVFDPSDYCLDDHARNWQPNRYLVGRYRKEKER